MRIALVNHWFAEKMGYSENCLPKALAAFGHDVHVISSDAQPYFDSPGYAETYEPFIGPGVVATGVKMLDGYKLHRLPHGRTRGRIRIKGLRNELKSVRPEVVHAFETSSLSTVEVAWAQRALGYKLFLESHVHASVFNPDTLRAQPRTMLWWWAYRRTAGALINSRSERCYAVSKDAADLAIEWFGIAPEKIELGPLGVDTDNFRPAISDEAQDLRLHTRSRLGFRPDEIVCIYTGRFAPDKGPQLLAAAIEMLVRRREPFRGLFVGGGTYAETSALRMHDGNVVHPFVPVDELAPLYQAADIGVWPKQESTSQLDAAACGLPIVISDRVTALERIAGNGLTYVEGDASDLAEKLLSLKSAGDRTRLGQVGSDKMQASFSWRRIARQRLDDYAAALAR